MTVFSIDKQRVRWVDFAKFMAIIAVLIDHSNDILHQNSSLDYLTSYSVSLFILIMGITLYWSLSRISENYLGYIKRKCKGIIYPYIIATIIYSSIMLKGFYFGPFLDSLIHFDANLVLYYVSLYIQLLLVAPFIFFILKTKNKDNYISEITGIIIVIIISYFTTNYTNILSIYGGGGRLFGGTYLILFYIGMWFAKYYRKIEVKKYWQLLLLCVMCIVTIFWWLLLVQKGNFLDKYIPFGDGINPPSIMLSIYAICVLLTSVIFDTCINTIHNKYVLFVYGGALYIGRHTLYIFLYHKLFLRLCYFTLSDFLFAITICGINFGEICSFIIMIMGSLLIEQLLKKMKITLKKAYL